jgi:DNA (cytosine-5)-methyltransferase 1
MKHFGDITKINGAELPIVDIVTGGSPCQDLSVAGKRAGLAGERSGLFMEQIRIIKEMRDEHTKQLCSGRTDVDLRCVRPRYMVWENVPGAFSSNKGEDFRAVLEETARVADKNAAIPGPPGGRWTPSGCIMGDGWSIAWRVHDAQFWGVPQRRKRIALVADFGGETAPEILFERESVSGNLEPSGEEREAATSDTSGSPCGASYTLKIRGGVEVDSHGKKAGKGPLVQTELSSTLGVSQDQTLITHEKQIEEFVYAVNKSAKHQQDLIQSDLGVARTLACGTHASGPHLTKTLVTGCLNAWDVQSKHIQAENGVAEALYSGECRGGGGESYVMSGISGEVAETIDANYHKGCGEREGKEREVVYCLQGNGIDRADTAGCNGKGWRENESYTLNTIDRPAVAFSFDSLESNSMKSSNPNSGCRETEVSKTIDCADPNPSKNQGGWQ